MNTRKIGVNRGKRRLWLEGNILTIAGFKRGDTYTVTIASSVMTITLDPNGNRKIAGTDARPIIDINSDTKLAELGDSGDLVQINNSVQGQLIISRVNPKDNELQEQQTC